MIDFIKFQLVDYNIEAIRDNEYLDFISFLNLNTGEISKFKFASYNGLKFKIYDPSEVNPGYRITVEGSLHKYWNKGHHNYNDFNYDALLMVMTDLKNKFKIIPEKCVLKQIEFGVNINPPVPSSLIIKNCLFHKTRMFKWISVPDEGIYQQAEHQRFIVKIYDKKMHYLKKGYKINSEILRFEVKFLKMIELNKHNIYNFQDLLSFGLINFIIYLLNIWEHVLFYDFLELDKTNLKEKYSNPHYWLDLKSENFKYHRKKLNSKINENPLNLKKCIAILILLKGIQLSPHYYLN